MGKEFGIFIHPYAHSGIQGRAKSIIKKVPGGFLTQQVPDLEQSKGPILIVGGDGSVRRVTQLLYNNRNGEELRPLGLLGGGTVNVLRQALIRTGVTLTLEEFLARHPRDFGGKYLLRPGRFGGQIFNITVGLGQFEQMAGLYNEKLRAWVPRRLRSQIASLFSLIPLVHKMNPEAIPLNLFSTSPDFGQVKLFPKQELQSSLLTHAWIEEKGLVGFKKLLLTLCCWQTRIEPLPFLLRTEQAATFHLVDDDPQIWVDGDTILRRTIRHKVLVSRAARAIAVTAII